MLRNERFEHGLRIGKLASVGQTWPISARHLPRIFEKLRWFIKAALAACAPTIQSPRRK
jgi:hypothetical protein